MYTVLKKLIHWAYIMIKILTTLFLIKNIHFIYFLFQENVLQELDAQMCTFFAKYNFTLKEYF